MPPGISVVSVEPVPLKSPALATLFRQAIYQILLQDAQEHDVQRRIDDLLERSTVPVEFRRKRFDLRPLVGALTLTQTHKTQALSPACAEANAQSNSMTLHAVLLCDERGRTGRPDVLLEALGLAEHVRGIHREGMVFEVLTPPDGA